ncbi:MAG: hemolysin family protein [Balneolales bacterium]
MELLIFYLILAVAVSFLCSILEAVLLSITPSYIAVLEQKGSKAGKALRSLKEDIDRPLAAILSLNTIAHTFGAAGVGAQSMIVFGSAYVTVTSIVVTLLILVFSEIIPKTVGATYWKQLAVFVALVTKFLIVITYPLVVLSIGITKWISSEEKSPTISREEFSAMAARGVEEGVFEEDESNIFTNLMRFNFLKVKDIMTPRIMVVKFPENTSIEEAVKKEDELRVSRLPVYGDNEEEITGYVLKNDLYLNLSKGMGNQLLKEIKREVLIIPDSISLKTLFARLLKKQEHIAVVVDEYGGFSGVVTMEDVVETLLGMEIMDEFDHTEDLQKKARQQWIERAKKLGIVIPDSLKDSDNINPGKPDNR